MGSVRVGAAEGGASGPPEGERAEQHRRGYQPFTTPALVRKSCSFSRSLAMHEARIKCCIDEHNQRITLL
ncbi:hypothetical protein MUN82_12830 [Hymenobacter aerilatus]|uniref:Uncharacterized protein n=1 Tax=Hymenobacter aerilatus TaxID=2932251 RepID=A0A8T9SR48_9BACT|nr:hypothetical protein [Hymenobacter aerilatus]UOR03831.1 hypothetical protein MUN82_12830 [Hymenobacter aerilatus]